MANRKLIELARSEGIFIATKYGIVDARSTVDVYGEGPNVNGFRWARGVSLEQCIEKNRLDRIQRRGDRQLVEDYPGLYYLAEAWAQDKAEEEGDETRMAELQERQGELMMSEAEQRAENIRGR